MDILQTLGNVTGFTQHNIDNQLLKDAVDAGRISENQYKTMGGYNVSQTMPQNLGLGYGDVGLASLGYQGMKKFAGGLDKLYDMTGGKIGIEDTMGMSKYGNIGALESIYLNTMGAKKGLDPYNLQTYQSILGQYKPVGGMYPGGKHELTAPRTRFKQQQLMNKKKQNFQNIIKAAEAKAAAEAAAKATSSFDPSGPTQASIRRDRADKSGRGHSGGFTDPGKGSYGPHKADGGLINFYRYGGFI